MEEEQKLFKTALSRAMFYCSKAERCPADVYKKLADWQIEEHLWEKVIEKLRNENFLSDQRFAEAFVRDKIRYNKWGRKKVLFQLAHKGLNRQTVEEAIYAIGEDEYVAIVRGELKKKFASIKEEDNFKLKAKIFNFAASRGYEGAITESIFEELIHIEE